ncbi:hypothetical protein BHECKSOX_2185 [Bathymodiolus heckerae thiotrophic gill symbiont]|nr:hypothetical protein BHECKSOX_2185 [Bathymodiolus heckerae thiotrophic gill symbiont]
MNCFKLPILVFFILFLSSCVTFDQSWKIDKTSAGKSLDKIKIGDIVITAKDWKSPLSWFGHSAIMIDKYRLGEYPELGYGYYETDIILWLSKKKKFTVLRYKGFDEKFKKAFLKNVSNAKYKNYQIVSKTNNDAFYCSQYIWYLYWKTAKDLGYKLDIDFNGGYFVTPYDLLNSQYFDKVLFTP